MYGKQLLPVLLQLHLALIFYRTLPDRDACRSKASDHFGDKDDIIVLLYRLSQSSYAITAGTEAILMLCTLALAYVHAAKKTRYLPPAARLLPALLVISALSLRARHNGMFGCASGDAMCCSNMFCAGVDGDKIPGCDIATQSIDWKDRRMYCPNPSWYDSHKCKNGLSSVPNLAKCHEYGCSKANIPLTYYSSRVELVVVLLFGVLGIITN